MDIILASASPQRKELLERIGLTFQVDPSSYPEDSYFDLKPRDRAVRVSLEKAKIVAARHSRALVIAADTAIVLKGKMLGKPQSAEEAKRMLETLNGQRHLVVTGLTIVDSESDKTFSRAVETQVHVRKLSKDEIESYVRSGEPLGKAGAYAIQGLGALIVDKIEGDYFNVVGLPLSALARGLKRFGVSLL